MEYADLAKWVKSDLERVLPGAFQFYKGPGVLGAKWKYAGGFKQILLSTVQYRPVYHVRGVSALIRFDVVEDILEGILRKYAIPLAGIGETIKTTLPDVGMVDYSFNGFAITDEESYGVVFAQLEKLIKLGALPFFEQYDALEQVNKHIESLPVEKLSGFISGDVALKRLVIKRLCNNPDWIDHGRMILEFFKENAVKEPRHYKNLDAVTQELMEVLSA